jgi:hypothetical protein
MVDKNLLLKPHTLYILTVVRNFAMRVLLLTYAGLTFLMVTDLLLYLSRDISLPGHVLDWLLFWAWLIMTVAVIFSNFKKKWIKFYGATLIVFTILTMLPMMIPFLTILAFAATPEDKRYRIRGDMELQELQRYVVGRPTIVAIKSFWFYEKIVGETFSDFEINGNYREFYDVKSIRLLNEQKADSLKVEFKFDIGTVVKTM